MTTRRPSSTRISRLLTGEYAGKSLDEIRTLLVDALAAEKARMDRALARALELGRHAFSGSRPEDETVFVDGTESLLEKPEFRGDLEALRRMFRAFEEKARLVSLLTDCLAAGGDAGVVIGSESPFTDETQTAVVAAPYRQGRPGPRGAGRRRAPPDGVRPRRSARRGARPLREPPAH